MGGFVTRTLCGLLLLFTVACSDSPTAPTATEPPTASGPPVIALNWGVTAASCGNVSMPPSQPAFASATLVRESDTAIMASWPNQGERNGTLYARFLFENNVWGLCSWDIADV
jgi:hypothetical protein